MANEIRLRISLVITSTRRIAPLSNLFTTSTTVWQILMGTILIFPLVTILYLFANIRSQYGVYTINLGEGEVRLYF